MSTQHFPDGRGSNIICLLKGSDPELRKEVIIIGAHLDHMGRCYEIIPGANDNASTHQDRLIITMYPAIILI